MPGSISSSPDQKLISTICSGITCDTSNGTRSCDYHVIINGCGLFREQGGGSGSTFG